ncbi:MAG: DUF3780 domain-containing protein [Desulfobulbaceae bacterium]|nr:DUF3780 domain-containing protein [Desulfobulbaceae bacterium]
MNTPAIHDFGVVDPLGDTYELYWEDGKNGQCRLDEIIQTERGPRRSELALIPAVLWSAVSERVVRELAEGMGETERPKKAPMLKRGPNRMSTLIGRELAILFWALMEVGENGNVEAILHGWRELAREERWWLYAKAAAPGQHKGAGWRLALFHALSETPDSRTTKTETTEKKSPGNGFPKAGKVSSKGKKPPKKQPLPGRKPAGSLKATNVEEESKKAVKPSAPNKTNAKKKKPAAKTKKTTKKAAQRS